jgi:hypothetical protein
VKRFLISALAGIMVFGYTSASAVKSEFHGQFRINSYSQTESDTFGRDVAASRLRWRPTWDVAFENGVKMHMQLNIGHIKENMGNARLIMMVDLELRTMK